MQTLAADSFDTGHMVEAKLAPHALDGFDPMLRRLLGGHQLFVKQADGRWRPRGCSLGLAQCFDYADLLSPASQG